jgi:hypothetical protein
LEASVPGRNSVLKFRMPAVYLPKNEKVYRCKVGYWLSPKSGKRERKEFRLSTDPVFSHRKALTLSEKWMREEERHTKVIASFNDIMLHVPITLPVWTGTSQCPLILN